MTEQVDENVPTPVKIMEGEEPKAWSGAGERIPSAKPETLPLTGARNKRRASESGATNFAMLGLSVGALASMGAEEPSMASSSIGPPTKNSRTNTPWTPADEQRLKTMRDAGTSWADIAKVRFAKAKAGVAQEPKTEILADFPE
jgi:hypothetical protein